MGFFGPIGRVAIGIGGSIVKGVIPGDFENELIDRITGSTASPKKIPGRITGPTTPAAVPGRLNGRGDPFGGGRGSCSPPLIRDSTGICVFPGSPADVSTDVFEGGPSTVATSGRLAVPPTRAAVMVDRCPKFADGATGILWMSALTGQVVCLPRRANGGAFGLIRKNKPRRKPFISAAQKKQLDSIKSVQTKAKAFATAAGFKCTTTKKTVKGTPKKKAC